MNTNPIFAPGEDVVYNGRKFPEMRNKLATVEKVLHGEDQAVVSFNGEGYRVQLANLAKKRGTDAWVAPTNFADRRRSDGRVRRDSEE